jgi:hypothetical protein
VSPLTPLRVRVSTAEHAAEGSTRRVWTTEVELRHYVPSARLDIEGAGALLRRRAGGESGPEWLGRGVVGFRLPAHLTLRGRSERSPYMSTVASLRSRIVVDSVAAELQWDSARGWLAQAAVARQQYPDDNATDVRYAWFLAPIVRTPAADVHMGYTVASEHAEASRFVPIEDAVPDPVTFAIAGNYAPYYTPNRVTRHSIAGALRVRPSGRATLRVNGSFGFSATENVPQLFSVDGAFQRFFFERNFNPWEGRGSLEIAATRRTTVALTADAGRSTFYRWHSAFLQLTYRFVRRSSEASQ